MKLTLAGTLVAFSATLLCGLSPASAAPKASKHASFLKQAQRSPDKILELSASSEFEEVVASPRNYSISMLLTAVDSGVACAPCVTFQPTYQNLARSYNGLKGDATSRHLFALLEFKNGREIFQKLQLQYAPVLLFFPATSGPYASSSREPVTFDFARLGFGGGDVATELSKQLGITVPYRKPIQWKLGALAVLCTSIIAACLYSIVPHLASNSLSGSLKTVWSILLQAIFLVTIVVMCAGQMWNSIRNAPYMQMGSNGKPEYFAGGFQNQYGAETHIVALVYAILAFSTVSLTILVPMQRDPVKQRAGVYVWSAILLAAFSLLIYIFRIKNPSYPFRLFF